MSTPSHGSSCVTRTYPLNCYNCGQAVFFFSCTCGSKKFFEKLGQPWPLHSCSVDVAQPPSPPQINNIAPPPDIKKILPETQLEKENFIGVMREKITPIGKNFSGVEEKLNSSMALEMVELKNFRNPIQITIAKVEENKRYSYTGVVDAQLLGDIKIGTMVIVSICSLEFNQKKIWIFNDISRLE